MVVIGEIPAGFQHTTECPAILLTIGYPVAGRPGGRYSPGQ